MSEFETLEEFIRRYDILVGVGGGLTATDKQVAAIRRLLEENKQLEKGMDDLRALYRNSGNVGKDMVRVSVSPTEFEELWPAEAAIEIERLLESVDRLQQTWAENKPAAMYKARIDAALAVAGEGNSYFKVERMVKALKGEK